MSKAKDRKITHLREVCISAAYLLQALQNNYEKDFGHGFKAQMKQCLLDCNEAKSAYTETNLCLHQTETLSKATYG